MFKPYIEFSYPDKSARNRGYLGTPTNEIDADGQPLFVGDLVHIVSKTCGSFGNVLVCEFDGKFGVFGNIDVFNDFGKGEYTLTKVKSYNDFGDGEIVPRPLRDTKNLGYADFVMEKLADIVLKDLVVRIRLTPKKVDFTKVWNKPKGE